MVDDGCCQHHYRSVQMMKPANDDSCDYDDDDGDFGFGDFGGYCSLTACHGDGGCCDDDVVDY